ncbi:MAG: ribonuclease III [Planctomycetota bacterium]|nr:ribonuclease III [Planctomycetota bacterium]
MTDRNLESSDTQGLGDDAIRLKAVEDTLQFQFENPKLLLRALTHSSAKSDTQPSNERLEFLGDAILGLVVTDHLFRNFEGSSEGVLTRLKSVLVSSKTIGAQIRRLKLDRFLIISRGLQKNNAVSQSMCADLFEAIIGAIYLDGGIEAARSWILHELNDAMSKTFNNLQDYNWKSRLQQYTQKHFSTIPSYVLEDASGPDHCPNFAVTVYINENPLGHGQGTTKKGAQQAAAKVACNKLMGLEATRVDISEG